MRIFKERDRLKLLNFSNLSDAYKMLAQPSTEPVKEIPSHLVLQIALPSESTDAATIDDLIARMPVEGRPSWAKGEYSLNEYFDILETVDIVSFLREKSGIPASDEELVELFYILIEKRVRVIDGVCEKHDGEDWQFVARVPSNQDAAQ